MSGYANAPYGFGFAPDPFLPQLNEAQADAGEQPDEGDHPKEPRYNYSAMHSAIKRNREWYR
ncbi:hypothetical protein [Sphingomonas sp.]|jgi:hypothetical protein|uniref:hypothetical protein n=1 Tax=Sphingomonas sp. TaxID=28214 RepID=UPI002DE91EA4|nr:hypothetical protein [Sphingomonas sp.]